MKVVIGSTNPTKKLAAEIGVKRVIPDAEVIAVDVDSGVSVQPMSDKETKKGAMNRAIHALEKLKDVELAIGLEGGVQIYDGVLYNSVWVCVADRMGKTWFVNGERFPLPKKLAQKIQAGEEMGPALDELIQEKDIKKGRGMIGVLTGGAVTRPEAYASLVRLAVGIWFGKDTHTLWSEG
ncbi:MAG: NTPase [Microgenomates group bacterium GW2011_GWF2_45_18]|nr:MAG: NTPase [Microgenomates group bacterium GW2011_GWF1_44_10]KKU02146.1 MAG: NTPase [Microgenomates group bacterium GW2011_GWF2_45_18]OGJ41588.1 MAG: hypothetical protein A2378_04035 [Candidatus Pacebacteria bacterium RIFOXYB1_FULL_44_10]HAU98696.1 inosine/xanthosine triphosphatase [Candidatus Paceibacterota bacterium]HAX01878.1 inosine/xanthosine triphosphatase [Candidatus Paceibacterota bacterium]